MKQTQNNENSTNSKKFLTPYNFPSWCDQTQFTHIYLPLTGASAIKRPSHWSCKFVINLSHHIRVKRRNITSMIVPLVITPREVYIWPLGFFFTPIISRLKVHLSSGCVTWALVNRNPEGRMNRSYLGGFLVKAGPTNVALVTILFHCLAAKDMPDIDC